jgi:hypothetical protein
MGIIAVAQFPKPCHSVLPELRVVKVKVTFFIYGEQNSGLLFCNHMTINY